VNSHTFTIKISLLAGKTRAIRENADKRALKQLVQDFQAARGWFEEILFVLHETQDISAEQHARHLIDISYDLAATSYILDGRITKKDVLWQHIREVCSAIDSITKALFHVTLVGPMFDFFVRSRQISEEAKTIVHLQDVRPPQLLRGQVSRQRAPSAPTIPRVQSLAASKAPPPVPKRYRVEHIGPQGPARPKASTAPPTVSTKYRVEHVGPQGPARPKASTAPPTVPKKHRVEHVGSQGPARPKASTAPPPVQPRYRAEPIKGGPARKGR
jgi:hypothetical protein